MEPRILQEACESGVSSGAFFAVLIVMIITSAAWIGFFVNGRYGCLPLVFIRFVNDKSFLAEYERRLDKVVEHDLKKKYHVGRKLGEGVTSQVYRIQERSSSTFFALKKIPLKGSASLQRAVEREIKILKKLRHHHVTTLHDVYQSPNRIWAVLEFVSGGEMTHYISTEVRRQATAAPSQATSSKSHAAKAACRRSNTLLSLSLLCEPFVPLRAGRRMGREPCRTLRLPGPLRLSLPALPGRVPSGHQAGESPTLVP